MVFTPKNLLEQNSMSDTHSGSPPIVFSQALQPSKSIPEALSRLAEKTCKNSIDSRHETNLFTTASCRITASSRQCWMPISLSVAAEWPLISIAYVTTARKVLETSVAD